MFAKKDFLAAFLSVPVALAAAPSMADSWKDESGHGKYEGKHRYKEETHRDKHSYKYEWRDGNCKYKYEEDGYGFKEERKCRYRGNYLGGPPPWVPAHGYRRQHSGDYYGDRQIAYVPPFDIDSGRCNRELLGSLLGAAAGGFAGSQIGDGRGQLAAVAGGTVLGYLLGGTIGRSMDSMDQNCIGQALEHAGDGQQIVWDNPRTGDQYQVVPTQTVQRSDGHHCREYTATAVVNGRSQQTYGRACRQPDGSWKLVD